MKSFTVIVTATAIVVGSCALSAQVSSGWTAIPFFLPLSLGPLLVTLLLVFVCQRALSLGLLLISTVLYGCWFAYVYASAFHWHLDPQSGIAMVFVGLYSLPVMIPLWWIAYAKLESPGESGRWIQP